MNPEIRTVREDEFAAFHDAESTAFGQPPSERMLEAKRRVLERDRMLGAWVDDQLVGTATAYSFGLTVPGGDTLAAAGVAEVTVAATHRRRGILTAVMAHQLDDVAHRQEPVAVLDASEAGIYRSFGYGIAQLYQSWALDTRRARFREPAGDDLKLRRIDRSEAARVLPPIYDAWRRQQPGAITHSAAWWSLVLDPMETWKGGGDIFIVVSEATAEHGAGFAIYLIDNRPEGGEWVVDARNIVAPDDVVEARLWRYLLEIDLVGEVRAEVVALDNPLRWWLTDPRSVRTTQLRDYLFVRILDVPAALSARRYQHDGRLTIAVRDPFRPTTAGRFELAQQDGSVTCGPTDLAPDIELDIAELGSLYLGGVTARELARAQRIIEHTPGAIVKAEDLFGWPVAPFCITKF